MPETWDCFFFNDELDLLEFRLAELDLVVDRFVVVEGDRTFTGLAKQLVLQENLARFSRYGDRLVPVVARLSEDAESPWVREAEQRAAMRRAVAEGNPDDLLVVGDVDEIPDRDRLVEVRQQYERPVRLGMRHAIYHANWVVRSEWLDGPYVSRRADIGQPGIRDLLEDAAPGRVAASPDDIIHQSGWHLSSLGGPERLLRKLAAYSHQEFNTSLDRNRRHVERCHRYGVHFTGVDVVDRLGPEGLDPLLQRLHRAQPGLFDFTPAPATWRRRAYAGYTWARRSGHLPAVITDFVDGRERGFGAIAPVMLAVDTFRRARRRLTARGAAPAATLGS